MHLVLADSNKVCQMTVSKLLEAMLLDSTEDSPFLRIKTYLRQSKTD